MPKSKSYA